MSTNYFLMTADKGKKSLLGTNYTIVDEPYFGYEMHIMKKSFGWLPLFEYHPKAIESVADIKRLYDGGGFEIYDEYGRRINWDEFEEVFKTDYSKFKNGNIDGLLSHIAQPPHPIIKTVYHIDEEGYEFLEGDFC